MFWPKKPELRQIHQTLTENGKINKKDLVNLWNQKQFAQFIPDDDIRDYIIKILLHLDILIEPKHMENVISNFYLVPCTVKNIFPTNVLNDPDLERKAICLSYRLVKSTVPAALSFKVIGAALSMWPFEEKDGRPMLFFKSAVLCVDDTNELRIYVEEKRIFVYLINAVTKQNISPDIAASIQESLTWALKNALDFYHRCMGKNIKAVEIEELFEVEVGGICQKNVCLLKLSEAEKHSTWTCERDVNHSTKYPRFWVFDKTIEQDACPHDCSGLNDEELSQYPTDKHLVRLAAKVGIRSFSEFMVHLGLTKAEWEGVEYMYNEEQSIKFMALHTWRKKKESELTDETVTLAYLNFGLQNIGHSEHHLCQIFRERPELVGVPQIIPDDDMLQELSRKVGNCVIQLGIELGLEVTEVEQTMYAYPKDLFQQIYDILRKCRDKNKANTLYILMRSLQRVKSQAVKLLIKKYDIKTSSKTPQEERTLLRKGKPGERSSQERSSYEEKGAIPKRSKPILQTGLPTRHSLMEAGFRGEESKLETKQGWVYRSDRETSLAEHSSQERSGYEEKGAIPKRSKPTLQTGLPRHSLMEPRFRREETKLETVESEAYKSSGQTSLAEQSLKKPRSAKKKEREKKREPKKTVSDFIRKFIGFKK